MNVCLGVALTLGLATRSWPADAGDANFATLRHLGRQAFLQGDFVSAEKLFVRALNEVRDEGEALSRADILTSLGGVCHVMGKYREAERYCRQALDIHKRAATTDDVGLASATNNLAALYIDLGRFEQAERTGIRLIAERLESPQPNAPALAMVLGTVAALDMQRGKLREAERRYQAALVALDKLGPGFADSVVQTLGNLGALCQRQNRSAEALAYWRRALTTARGRLGPQHPAQVMLLVQIGRWEKDPLVGEGNYRQALDIAERALGPHHVIVGQVLASYAKLLRRMKRKGEASRMEARAADIVATVSANAPGRHTVEAAELARGSVVLRSDHR